MNPYHLHLLRRAGCRGAARCVRFLANLRVLTHLDPIAVGRCEGRYPAVCQPARLASFEVERTWRKIPSAGGEDDPKRTHVQNSPASGGNAAIGKERPTEVVPCSRTTNWLLTQLLFDAFVGEFRRSADRSGNRVLHLVAHDREISLLFYANPTRPCAALYFQDENPAIGAY